MSAWAEIEANLPAAALAALRDADAVKQGDAGDAGDGVAAVGDATADVEDAADVPSVPTNYTHDAALLARQAAYQAGSAKTSLLGPTPRGALLETIRRDGVVRINDVLPAVLCDRLRATVNADLLAATTPCAGGEGFQAAQAGTPGGFGRVYSRKNRFDLYCQYEGIYAEALRHLLKNKVGLFLRDLFQADCRDTFPSSSLSSANNYASATTSLHPSMVSLTRRELNGSGVVRKDQPVAASLWEFSTMTSDPGAPRQPIHPDNSWTPRPVLYTAFVALQDIDSEMGPTLFLPGTQSKEAHEKFLSGDAEVRRQFLEQEVEYCTSPLRRGDVQIMDSRILHAGLDNASPDRRRTLFYFTMANPACAPEDFVGVPSGSKWPHIDVKLEDFLEL